MTPRLVLPLPPSQNQIYQVVRRGRRGGRALIALTPQAVAWRAAARTHAQAWAAQVGWRPTTHTKVKVAIWVWWPNPRRRDPANLLKLLLDALEGVVYDDDRWALPQIVDFAVDPQAPRVELAVTVAAPEGVAPGRPDTGRHARRPHDGRGRRT
jgi:crossover junction endodeoxyribonuclease RusA